nr:MAG TPA: hypothetical protein [Caudoviricetes sp.]
MVSLLLRLCPSPSFISLKRHAIAIDITSFLALMDSSSSIIGWSTFCSIDIKTLLTFCVETQR